jgi:hypothetical protein
MLRAGRAPATEVSSPSVGELLGRLSLQLRRFLEQKLALARVEVKTGLRDIVRDAVLIATGAVLAVLGIIHLVIALSLWVGDLLGSRPAGFALVGGLVAIGGAVAAMLGLRGLQAHSVVPRQTVTELRRDVAWIKNEL